MHDTGPSYELSFEQREQYLFAHVKAPTIDQNSALAYLTEVFEECKRTNSRRLLIVRDIPEMLSDGTLFFVTAEFQRMIGSIRTAFVNPYISNEDAFKFAITVGTNRGANYRLFKSVPEAEEWLLSNARVA